MMTYIAVVWPLIGQRGLTAALPVTSGKLIALITANRWYEKQKGAVSASRVSSALLRGDATTEHEIIFS